MDFLKSMISAFIFLGLMMELPILTDQQLDSTVGTGASLKTYGVMLKGELQSINICKI